MVPQASPSKSQPQTAPPKTHTIAGELHQIRAYVDATNTRISYISSLLSNTSTDEITEIKRRLKDAHRGLEKLETRFRGLPSLKEVVEITGQVWNVYTRLRVLEEGLRDIRNVKEQVNRERGFVEGDKIEEGGKVREMREGEAGVVYVPSGAKRRMLYIDGRVGSERRKNENHDSETYMMSGGLSTLFDPEGSLPEYIDTDEKDTSSNEISSTPNGEETQNAGYNSFSSGCGSTTLKSDSHFVVRRLSSRRTYALRAVPKSRDEVIASMSVEMHRTSITLHDPDRGREGSTSGWLTTLAIMSGLEDGRYVLPILTFIKIHEVRDLKKWLVDRGFLQRSGSVSRIERVLHFIFVLQIGCRLETIAVMFSRSPREVQSSCNDVLEGILHMHSETELLNPDSSWPIYPDLWRITEKFEPKLREWATGYYPWKQEHLQMVIVTLNLFIGRYRKQGQFALGGPFLNWGRYIQPEQAEEI